MKVKIRKKREKVETERREGKIVNNILRHGLFQDTKERKNKLM